MPFKEAREKKEAKKRVFEAGQTQNNMIESQKGKKESSLECIKKDTIKVRLDRGNLSQNITFKTT